MKERIFLGHKKTKKKSGMQYLRTQNVYITVLSNESTWRDFIYRFSFFAMIVWNEIAFKFKLELKEYFWDHKKTKTKLRMQYLRTQNVYITVLSNQSTWRDFIHRISFFAMIVWNMIAFKFKLELKEYFWDHKKTKNKLGMQYLRTQNVCAWR